MAFQIFLLQTPRNTSLLNYLLQYQLTQKFLLAAVHEFTQPRAHPVDWFNMAESPSLSHFSLASAVALELEHTGNLYEAVPRFGEFSCCCYLPLLPQLA